MKILIISSIISSLLLVAVFISKNAGAEETVIPCGGAQANWYPKFSVDPPDGRKETWQQNSSALKIYIDEAFSDDQENGIRDALGAFQNARITNKSGVQFDIAEDFLPLPSASFSSSRSLDGSPFSAACQSFSSKKC